MAKRSFDEAMDQGSRTTTRQAKNVYVSFSKRRKSLFRKASELCTICNAQIAVFVLSPTGNPFAFGHSSVDGVLGRFLGQTTPTDCRFITHKQRCQAEQVERLRLRVKELVQKPESKVKAWIEKEWEAYSASTTSLEELELLNRKYLALLDKIRNRLSFLGREEKVDLLDGRPLAVVNSSDDMSHSEEKLSITCADYVDTSIKKGLGVGSSSSSFVGEEEKVVYGGFPGGRSDLFDVSPLSAVDSSNDMSYSIDKFGTSFANYVDTSVKEGFKIGSSSFLGEGTSGAGPFNEYLDFESVGMEYYSSFSPQIGGYVYPISVVNSSNDMSYSEEKFGAGAASVNASIEKGLGISSSLSFIGEGTSDGVGPFNNFLDFDSLGVAGYSTHFPQIGSCICPLGAMDSSNDMSFLMENPGTNCATYGTNSVGGLPGPCSGVAEDEDSPAMTVAQNDMPSVEFSDANFGSNYNAEGISDDEVFDYLGRVDFTLFSEYSM